MKYLLLSRSFFLFPNSRRHISIELWKSELTHDLKKHMEDYWSKRFKYENRFDKNNLKDKYYVLSMFPYPSGNLHIGHVRVYTITDMIARYLRMNGKNVFQPMGWDSFGLPAENAAMERGIDPAKWIDENISQMEKQLKGLRCNFDWNAEFSTCDPKYYRWTQYLFLKLFESNLAYQQKAVVNWDPVDKTVLADEQVDEEGRSWRSGAEVEKKLLKQWFVKTTKFSKELYEALDRENLINWKDIFAIQKHWIGECNGYTFNLQVTRPSAKCEETFLNVWVKDPTSVAGAEFIAVQPTNIMYILYGHTQDADGKLDVEVFNPFTKRNIPIYASKYAPYPPGRDVYVGVPLKSTVDKEFCEKVKLKPSCNEIQYDREEMCEIARKSSIGGYAVSSKLRDWLISRQRYWGTPIPIIHCDKCGAQPVPYDQLPVVLPSLPENHRIDKALHNFLKTSGWVDTVCPKCAGAASRETDTMDTFVDSSWYYLRYIDVNNEDQPFNADLVNQMMPVDIYVGGKEHATLHLYYARFIHHFLHSIGLVKHKEPFRSLLCQGMVKGRTFKTEGGKYLKPDEVKLQGKTATCIETKEKVWVSWEKMSKSKYNGIDPMEVLSKYGVDTIRLFLLNTVSPRLHFEWDEKELDNTLKWQHRLWLTIREFITVRSNPLDEAEPEVDMEEREAFFRRERNRCVAGATYHYEKSLDLAAALKFLNELTMALRGKRGAARPIRKYGKEYEKALASLIIMLSPVVPHFAATLWFGFTAAPDRLNSNCEEINWDANVLEQKWPKINGEFSVPITFEFKNYCFHEISILNSELEMLTLEDAIKLGESHKEVSQLLQLNREQIILLKHENCEARVVIKLKAEDRLALLKKMIEEKHAQKQKRKESLTSSNW